MAKERASKMDSVRQALSALGADAKPKEIQEYLKEKLATDMTTNMISNYKTHILKKGGKGGRRRRRRAGRKVSPAVVAVARGGISMADIQAVKKLTNRIGVAKVKELATVLGK